MIRKKAWQLKRDSEMSDSIPPSEPSGSEIQGKEVVAWDNFLATHPPDKQRHIEGVGRHMDSQGPCFSMETPDLQLHCDSAMCGGTRAFHCIKISENQRHYDHWNWVFLTYRCRNCNEATKVYAVGVLWKLEPKEAPRPFPMHNVRIPPTTKLQVAMKFGEWPPLGPILPKRLLKLVGSDVESFKQGRRAEGQGMGIGAFAYYRRVVENQRTELFDKLIQAAQRLKVDVQTVEALKLDRDNWQFGQSVAGLKAVLPESLKIEGHNPIALLHNALSHNLHNESDAVCLEAAQDIRHVLTHFAERLHNALKDQTEIEKAVGRLTQTKAKQQAD
jgi:hypothetical protein